MSGRNVQRKLGTTHGSPRRSRTAKASRISRRAVKSRCACEWGGWGRLSDDGSGQNNPTSSEDPWGRWSIPPRGGALSSPQARHRADHRSDHEMHEGRRQTGRRSAYAGSRLKLIDASGRSRLKRQPFSRTGENPQSGMLGGIVETSASFEAPVRASIPPDWQHPRLFVPPRWYLCRTHPQWGETGRPSGRAADQVRAYCQPQDRQSPRPHHP